MGNALHFLCPRLIVTTLIEARLPCDDGAVVAVGMEHVAQFLISSILETVGVVKLLPAGEAVDHSHTVLVARRIKRRGMWIVRHPNEIKAPFLQTANVLKDGVVGLGIAEHSDLRMHIGAVELHILAVDIAAVAFPLHLADAISGFQGITDRIAGQDRGAHRIKLRRIDGPQARIFHNQFLDERMALACGNRSGILFCGNHAAIFIHNFRLDRGVLCLFSLILDVGLRLNGRALFGDRRRCQEDSAARCFVFINRIAHMQWVHGCEVYVPIQAAKVLEVRIVFTRVKGCVRTRIDAHCDYVLFPISNLICEVENKCSISALMGSNLFPIYPHLCRLHRSFKGYVELFALHFLGNGEMLTIPEDPQILLVVVIGGIMNGAMRQIYIEPIFVVEVGCICAGNISFIIPPVVVKIDCFSSRLCRGVGQRYTIALS